MTARDIASLAALQDSSPEEPLERELVVGKDLLQLFTTGMYVEPLTLFREYIQNAADAIDDAVATGILSDRSAGRIEIDIDPGAREVRIRDNGTGIPREEAVRRLTSFGSSEKRGTSARGFRGIGRLAGIGTSQAVTFRTKAQGETNGIAVRWDHRKIRELVNDATFNGTLSELVQSVVDVSVLGAEPADEHYFEVRLEKVGRTRGDVLLDEFAVGRYLSQVAPVPLSSAFTFTEEISAHLRPHLPFGHFDIRVNASEPLTRPFTDEVRISHTKTDRITGWEPIEVRDAERGVVAVGWVLHHGYIGAISEQREIRGLRARIGDLQVGGDAIFASVFPESRFNSWVIGELHIFDSRIAPNGRRDDFESNPASQSLANQLTPWVRRLTQLTRESSMRRARAKKLSALETQVLESLTTVEQGLLGPAGATVLRAKIESSLAEMEKAATAELFDDAARESLREKLDLLRHRVQASSQLDPSRLSGIPPERRDAYELVLQLVYETVGSPAAGRALVAQVLQKLETLHQSSDD